MIDTALEDANAPYDPNEEEDEPDIPETTPQKKLSKKRGHADDVDDTPAAPTQPAPAKKQKLEQQYDDTSIVAQGPSQPTHILMMKDHTYNITETFHSLRKISAQIKQKRQEIDSLYQQWLSLHAQIQPELADPFADKQ